MHAMFSEKIFAARKHFTQTLVPTCLIVFMSNVRDDTKMVVVMMVSGSELLVSACIGMEY